MFCVDWLEGIDVLIWNIRVWLIVRWIYIGFGIVVGWCCSSDDRSKLHRKLDKSSCSSISTRIDKQGNESKWHLNNTYHLAMSLAARSLYEWIVYKIDGSTEWQTDELIDLYNVTNVIDVIDPLSHWNSLYLTMIRLDRPEWYSVGISVCKRSRWYIHWCKNEQKVWSLSTNDLYRWWAFLLVWLANSNLSITLWLHRNRPIVYHKLCYNL